MYRFILIFTILLIPRLSSAQSFHDLRQIPRDTLTAQQSKIWIPVEFKSCSVTVKILDNENNLIRNLVSQKLYQGYYNIYWDKKNDSGLFVTDTSYKIALIACDHRKIYPIEVTYQKGENAALITAGTDDKTPALQVDFLIDSVIASLEIYNRRDILVDSIFSDSIYNNGLVTIPWNPSPRIPSGNYFYKLTLNGYAHWLPFKYNR